MLNQHVEIISKCINQLWESHNSKSQHHLAGFDESRVYDYFSQIFIAYGNSQKMAHRGKINWASI